MRKFCEKCGSQVSEATQFCPQCGATTEEACPSNLTDKPATSSSLPLAAEPQTSAGDSTARLIPAVSELAPSVSSSVMPTNIASTLSYLAGFVTGIIFLVLDP